jgi:hypothetical protein
MKDKVVYTREYIQITIDDPIYGNNVAIRDKYIREAKKSGRLLKIITPNGIGIMSPQKFVKGAKIFKKEFLIKGVPMRFFQNDVPITGEEHIIEDYTMPNAVRERLREKAIELGFTKREGY